MALLKFPNGQFGEINSPFEFKGVPADSRANTPNVKIPNFNRELIPNAGCTSEEIDNFVSVFRCQTGRDIDFVFKRATFRTVPHYRSLRVFIQNDHVHLLILLLPFLRFNNTCTLQSLISL